MKERLSNDEVDKLNKGICPKCEGDIPYENSNICYCLQCRTSYYMLSRRQRDCLKEGHCPRCSSYIQAQRDNAFKCNTCSREYHVLLPGQGIYKYQCILCMKESTLIDKEIPIRAVHCLDCKELSLLRLIHVKKH